MSLKSHRPTYLTFPPGAQDSIHVKALARAFSAVVHSGDGAADYLIFHQALGEGAFDLRGLEYFRRNALARAAKIIFIPSVRASLVLRDRAKICLNDWLYIVDLETGFSSLIAGSFRLSSAPALVAAPPIKTEQCRALLLGALGVFSGDRKGASERIEAIFSKSVDAVNQDSIGHYFDGFDITKIAKWLTEGGADEFYYALSLIARNDGALAHDLTHIRNDWRSDGAARSEGLMRLGVIEEAKNVLSAISNMREVLAAPSLRRAVVSGPRRFNILVIDDNMREGRLGYNAELAETAEAFFPDGFEIWAWNPLEIDERGKFQAIAGYASIKAVPGDTNLKLWNQMGKSGGASVEFSLREIAARFDFVLVDQLYKLARADEVGLSGSSEAEDAHFHGPALIRGFKRLIHDLKLPATKGPQIIALSRTMDPLRIYEALRGGAQDYLLKTQLIRLPAVLAKVQNATAGGSDSWHHNFPELYRLPNETQGLLRVVRIPPLPLHLKAEKGAFAVGNQWRMERFGDLLRTLPKPDLHVHVGTCMAPEFLVVSSLIGLICSKANVCKMEDSGVSFLKNVWAAAGAFRWLTKLPGSSPALAVVPFDLQGGLVAERDRASPDSWRGEKWISGIARWTRAEIKARLAALDSPLEPGESVRRTQYQELRGLLHRDLDVRDRLTRDEAEKKVDHVADLEVAIFGLRFSKAFRREDGVAWERDDLIRIYLLTLAASGYRGDQGQATLFFTPNHVRDCDFFDLFRGGGKPRDMAHAWETLRATLHEGVSTRAHTVQPVGDWTLGGLRRNNWRLEAKNNSFPLELRLHRPAASIAADYESTRLDFETAPIEYTLATGLRSSNLLQYLEGCEFAGAEHLRHPVLMHLYAQQVLVDFVDKGVFYAELRGSPDGYVNADLGFEFSQVCMCFTEAFNQAQKIAAELADQGWIAGCLGERYGLSGLSRTSANSQRRHPLLCKFSLIYVGKRHKSSKEMVLEAAAAGVMRPTGEVAPRSAQEFAAREFRRCRVVGFDLAGKEVGNPPERFVEDFGRLSKLHIPLTVHAGENESSQFVEDSILMLHARRIGHGLSLTEDKGLMVRVREDGIGIELCPISNFQTSHFTSPENRHGRRPYPLRDFLDRGILVSLNTDNPVISSTNSVREFFQASYSWGDGGMPLWEALRLIRMGYVMSFLSLPERRAMLELVGQYVFDLFSDEEMLTQLRAMAAFNEAPTAAEAVGPPK